MSNERAFDIVSRFVKEELGIESLDYWDEAPDFSSLGHYQPFLPEDWRSEVADGHTRQGYWEWVGAQLGIYEV